MENSAPFRAERNARSRRQPLRECGHRLGSQRIERRRIRVVAAGAPVAGAPSFHILLRSVPPCEGRVSRACAGDRIHGVNAWLCNQADQPRLRIDLRCKPLMQEFEQVCWKADPHGNSLAELDKSNPMRTHARNAVGYFVARDATAGGNAASHGRRHVRV